MIPSRYRGHAAVIASICALAVLVAVVALFLPSRQRTSVLSPSLARGELAALRLAPGDPAPLVPFEDADGRQVMLSRWRGRVIIVNFWGQWCAPCLEELPSLAELADAFPKSDLAVVAIALDREQDKEINREVLAELTDARLAFHFDPSFALTRALGAGQFPTTVVFGRDGREIARLTGPADWASPEARQFVAAAIGP